MKGKFAATTVVGLGILLGVCAPAVHAAPPSYDAAEKWADDFSQAMSESSTALLKPDEHPKQARRFMALEDRAKKLFGQQPVAEDSDLARCTSSVGLYASVWQFQASLVRSKDVHPSNVSGIALLAFRAGDDYRICRTAIEALDKKPIPKGK